MGVCSASDRSPLPIHLRSADCRVYAAYPAITTRPLEEPLSPRSATHIMAKEINIWL